MTIRIDLTPVYRKESQKRKGRIQRWTYAGCIYLIVLVAITLTCHVISTNGDHQIEIEMVQVNARIDATSTELNDLQIQIDEAKTTLRANNALREHPNWSLMLALLANALGQDLVLRECDLNLQTPSKTTPNTALTANTTPNQDAPQRAFRLTLRGFGRSQAAISQFTLRLEQTEIFDQVKLVDTSLEPFLSGKAIAFHVECRFASKTKRHAS